MGSSQHHEMKEDHEMNKHHEMKMQGGHDNASYTPLVLVLAGVLVAAVVTAWLRGDLAGLELMRLFMGYFFITFAAFKFLDLKAFADAYAEYDLVAARSKAYSLAYPFIELGLGLAYLASWQLPVVNVITLIVMLVSSAGVLNALLGKQKIRCACLGAVVKLPMTTVTLIEDLGMAAMAAVMLFLL